MKLYDVPDRTWVKVVGNAKVPPDAPAIEDGDRIFLMKIDGMYSYCKDDSGQICHLVAWQEVEIDDERETNEV